MRRIYNLIAALIPVLGLCVCGQSAEMDFFRDRLTVINGTVAWDVDGTRGSCPCDNLDPCELHETCPIVEDPLKEVI